MKRNGILLIGIFPLLFSCTAKKENSSNEYLSSEESSVSSELSSEEDVDQSLLTKLGNKLLSLEGTVSKSKTVLKRLYTYPSDATFDMYVENNYETTRYKRNTTYLVETKGTEQYEGQTPIPYTTQTYDNGKKFYQVTLYDDEDKTKKTESGKYDEKAVESTYSLGEAYKEIANFNYMLESRDNDLISYQFSNMEGIEEDNKLSYSYSLFIYTENDGQKILSQQISYENIFTIKNNLITHLSQKYENKTVVANVANVLTVNLETDYIQGQYTDFSGNLLSIL
mgnify:CR=1 FL=1